MDLLPPIMIKKIKNETQILDLCIGYCKIWHSIPLNIAYLVTIFYCLYKKLKIGKLIFQTRHILFTSLTASIIVKNIIFKIQINIGSINVRLFLNQNQYNTNTDANKQIIKTISGNTWNSDYVMTSSHHYKTKQYRIIFLINRQTDCHCVDSNHEIKIYILNYATIWNCSWYTLCRELERKHDDDAFNQNTNALIKIQLPLNVELKQEEMEIIMNDNDKGTINICDSNESALSFNNIIEGRVCCWR